MKFQHIVIFLLATIYSTFSSITLSCFSFPIIDLPSLGFSSSSGIYVQSGVNFLTNVGANTTATVDGCLWGLASVLLLEILPSILSGQAAQLFERISSSSDDTSDSVEPIDPYQQPSLPSLPAYSQTYPDYSNYNDVEGNRRLDVNEYEYIDTAPTSNDISLNYNMFYGQPQSDLEVAGLKVAPYGRGNGLEVTPILREAEPKTYRWSEPILNNNDYGWSEPEESWSEPKDVWVSPKNVLSDTFQQDYDDIDYTSGGLVTFHSSLS
eukprot:TRINITY_DN10477_c0_g1_i2.p1 TRINITY_DN10477_c0_g1~~TRINITY_DN10477_c0_g1_i2.p1  ORF type:complete len:266 (-),score=23.08 TRINITY_DN10477_c0_g1_i2:117-914(-)